MRKSEVVAPALAAETQLTNQRLVARGVLFLQVTKKTTALTYELKQPATRVMILLVRPKVIREVLDTRREERNLNLRGTGVAILASKLLDYFRLIGSYERHFSFLCLLLKPMGGGHDAEEISDTRRPVAFNGLNGNTAK